MKGVKTVVFTATRGDVAHSYLGLARTDALLRALAATEPWLQLARLQVEASQMGWYTVDETPSSAACVASAGGTCLAGNDYSSEHRRVVGNMRANPYQTDPLNVSKKFLEHLQRAQFAGAPEPENEWLPLPTAPGQETIWEHATWIAATDLTDGTLRDAVQPESYVLDDRTWSAEDRVRAVAQVRTDFVALLGPTRRFERLVDRRSLLEELGKSSVKP